MPTQTYVNLPVADVARATAFFSSIGFMPNPTAGESAVTSAMSINATTTVMLHIRPYFEEFVGAPACDTTINREVAIGLSAESREEVDLLVDRAVAAGGELAGSVDVPGMYMKAFRDPDGHQWSSIFVDPAAMGTTSDQTQQTSSNWNREVEI